MKRPPRSLPWCAARAPTLLVAGLLLSCSRDGATVTSVAPVAVDARPAAIAAPQLVLLTHACMGTKCELKIFHADRALCDRAALQAFAEVDRIEGLMSDWRPDSEVSRINDAAGANAIKVSPETLLVIKRGVEMGQLSGGAFDLTVGVFRGLWKFDEDNDGSIPARKDVSARRKLVNYQDILIDEAAATVKLRRRGQRLTLGGIAKGFAVDAAVKVVRANGINDFIFQAGGDLFASGRRGDRPWMVGIRDPRGGREQIIFKLSLTDRAFNTSGDYERFVIKDGVRYHHILDARTGFPVRTTRSVTLLARSAFEADLLDTTLFVLGPKRALEVAETIDGLGAVIVDAENHVFVSPGVGAGLIKVGEPSPGI